MKCFIFECSWERCLIQVIFYPLVAIEAVKKCPFLAEVTPLVKEASKEMQDDIIDLTPSENGNCL